MTHTHHASAPTSPGAVHRWRQTLIPTTRQAPADAEAPSHIFLSRAGYIRKVAAGVYDYLPLAWRSLRKISEIVRQEMDAAGAAEMLMPALEPIEFYKDTKRDIDYGDLLFKLTDRHGRTAALAPTHEEVITELMMASVTSWRQFPLSLYQIQTKYRDEFRPRSGLLRCREFIMKDAYSFHLSLEGDAGLDATYDAMHRAYTNIFTRCGLDFTVVEAESGPIGGSASHEFMVNADSGEDTILRCTTSGYAANVEKCEIGQRPWSFQGQPAQDLIKHHTPNMPGIEAVAEHLGVTPEHMLKTIVFKVTGTTHGQELSDSDPRWLLACVRGDHEVNEGKLKDASGYTFQMAPDAEARIAGFAIGYVSPAVMTNPELWKAARLLIDPDAAQGNTPWATGADEHDHHVTGFNWARELGDLLDDADRVTVADIRNAREGDPSPRAKNSSLTTGRGIEVGHIFKLGSKYSDAMGFTMLDKQQQKTPVIMGCYGIGVSRTLAACVEQNHDDNGILFPQAIAPYNVLIVVMKPDDARQQEVSQRLSAQLAAAGLDVLIDDREERPGVKFKDADLIGIPARITLGDKALDAGGVEFKRRTDDGKAQVMPEADAIKRCLEDAGLT